MKILSIYWGFEVGGIATYAANIERIRDISSIDIYSLCIIHKSRSVDFHALKFLRHKLVTINSVFDVSWYNDVRSEILSFSPDFVLSHGFNGHFVSFAVGLKSTHFRRLATFHGIYHPPSFIKRIVAPLYNRFSYWFLRNFVDNILVVSHSTKKILLDNNIPDHNVTVVHNGISEAKRSEFRDSIRKSWSIGPDDFVIGVVARLEKIKGLEYLIYAFSKLYLDNKCFRLIIVGDGPQADYLKSVVLSLKLKDNIFFAGRRNDVSDCLSAFDIFVLPSLSEAHSIALLEAMRAKLPIIATDVGGNTESVRHESDGIIVPPANVDALVCAINHVFIDVDLRERLANAAYSRFEAHFSENVMLERTVKWFERAWTAFQ